jgi:hypothetical protein
MLLEPVIASLTSLTLLIIPPINFFLMLDAMFSYDPSPALFRGIRVVWNPFLLSPKAKARECSRESAPVCSDGTMVPIK